jgi:hypothetical protein
MLSAIQQTHVKLIENKEEFAGYLESLAKCLDEIFFSDIDIGLQYLVQMQVTLDGLSAKAVTLLDEIGAEQKRILDRKDYHAHSNSSLLSKLTRAELLINTLTTKVVENIKQLLLSIPQFEIYKSVRAQLTEWIELAPLLKENLTIVMTTQAVIANTNRDQHKKPATNKSTIRIAVR